MVHIVRCLCGPARHNILNAADEGDAAVTRRQLEALLTAALATGEMNAHCALCGSPSSKWFYQVSQTAYRTVDEARPALQREEEAQMAVRRAAFASGLAYDAFKN